jgi:hypothetical protein
MTEIESILKELNIPASKLQEFAQRLQANPMAAMSLVQELNIPPEIFQKIIAIAMSNPSAIVDLAKKMGMSDEQINDVQDKIKPKPTSNGEEK